MPKGKPQGTSGGGWVFRDIPRDLMHKMKVAAAIERKSVKQVLIDLSRAHLEDMEKRASYRNGSDVGFFRLPDKEGQTRYSPADCCGTWKSLD